MGNRRLKRNVFQRLFGIPATGKPKDKNCWDYSDGLVSLDMDRVPELREAWGAIRLESEDMPRRILLVRGEGDTFYALDNCCKHGKRRLDPVSGENQVQCCSLGKSTYGLDGTLISGPAEEGIAAFKVKRDRQMLTIVLPR